MIRKGLDKRLFTPEIVFTEYREHGTELAGSFVKRNFEIVVVAVEVTQNSKRSGKSTCSYPLFLFLGIIPIGSGKRISSTFGHPHEQTQSH